MKMIEKINAFFKTTHKAALGLLAGTTVLNSAPAILTPQAKAADPPNIIFILADDLGWTGINCRDVNGNTTPGGEYDSMYYETPNIAELRKDSMRFTRAYACPTCKATRASLITGKSAGRCGGYALPLAETTIPEALDAGGIDYLSCFAGKWHLANASVSPSSNYYPKKQGFDYNYGGSDINLGKLANNIYWEPDIDNDPCTSDGFNTSYFPGLGDPDLNDPCEFLTDALTTRAIEFMGTATGEGKPFFLYLSFHAVHNPIQDNLEEELYPDEFTGKPDPSGRHNIQEGMQGEGNSADYAALTKRMDHNVGRVMEAIDPCYKNPEHSQREEDYISGLVTNNTIIIFMSDNGGALVNTSNQPLYNGKSSPYEGGIRVPMIVKWPGVTPANSTCDEPVTVMDIFPTIMEMAYGDAYDADDHPQVDGKSIVGVLEDPEKTISREKNILIMHPYYNVKKDEEKDAVFGLGNVPDSEGVDCTGYKYVKYNTNEYLFKIEENGEQLFGGKIGSALEFDGDNDHVDCGNGSSLNITGNIALAGWIKTDDTQRADIICKWGSGSKAYRLSINGGTLLNKAFFLLSPDGVNNSPTAVSSSDINDDIWHHVAGVYDGAAMSIYVDGNLEDSQAYSGGISLQVDENVYIGGERFFVGKIDDVRIYERALSPGQIKKLKSVMPKPIAHWKLDESSGPTAYDSSGNALNGTLQGDPNFISDPDRDTVLELNGIGDYIDIGMGPNTIQTIAFWIEPNSVSTTEFLFDLNGTQYIQITGGTVSAENFTDPDPNYYVNGATGTSVSAGEWSHIAVTMDTAIDANNIFIGKLGSNFYTGLIDDVRFYNKKLDPDEVALLAKGPVAHWELNCSPLDSSGNGNDGTPMGVDPNTSPSWTTAEDPENDLYNDSGYSDIKDALEEEYDDYQESLKPYIVVGGTTYDSISAAITAAGNGDVIILAPRTHKETINFDGKAVTLRSTDPCDWNVVGATIIDAEGAAYGVEFSSSETSSSKLKGLTITGATTTGVYCSSASPMISNCIISDNDSGNIGAGIRCGLSSPTISNCVIRNNDSVGPGAGIFCTGNPFTSSNPTIRNCVINNNETENSGGGIFCGVYSNPTITNCTIVDNTASVNGGGIFSAPMYYPTIRNCIIWGNGDDLYECYATYSCIEDGDSGTGNINSNPNFNDAAYGDYSLTSVSPCIDAGDGDAAPATDILGNSRYDDPYTANTGVGDPNYVDMGAFEYQGV